MAETVLNQEEQKIDQTLGNKKQNPQIKKVIGVVLSVVMIALTVYVFNLQNQSLHTLSHTNELADLAATHQAANYRSYVQQYKDTKQQLEETTRKLEAVQQALDQATAELNSTKGMLSETQAMLVQAQAENMKLKQQIDELEGLRTTENVSNIPDLEAKIKALKEKNVEVSSELNSVKTELRAFNADFSNLQEGKALLVLFENKLQLVKSRMRYLKQEAYYAKIAAQKEKDRIATLNGNNGFLLKDGHAKKSGQNFAIDVKMMQ